MMNTRQTRNLGAGSSLTKNSGMVVGVGDFLSSPLFLVINHPAKTGAGARPLVLLQLPLSTTALHFLAPQWDCF